MEICIKDVIQFLESKVPLSLQESYDNCGLLVGDSTKVVNGVLLCLDVTEEILNEAIQLNCNVIIAHHPFIFSGIKKITGANATERILISAIKNNIAIYAGHTNYDNVDFGVNKIICEKLGLKNTKILAPQKNSLLKLHTYAPSAHAASIRKAIFEAGAGSIGNYTNCSFNTQGQGTFRASTESNPFVGEKNQDHAEDETKIEVIFPNYIQSKVVSALLKNHPYEEVAYDIIPLQNSATNIGAGMIGELESEMNETDLLKFISEKFNAQSIRYTRLLGKNVKKVAVCGGLGSFLLTNAIAKGADFFITADFKYHQFFDAEGKIVIADIGHFESEQFTTELFFSLLKEKFSTFAIHFSKTKTNPINYFKA
jgi:dinuclear metal center YbgI/SA1388 family protein